MGYIRAVEILPVEVIEQIQQYVDGTDMTGELKRLTNVNCKN